MISSCFDEYSLNAYKLLFEGVSQIPFWHYLLCFLILSVVFLYNFLEFHFVEDVFSGFRGSPVSLTYHSCSHVYDGVVSKCRILHSRYLATPWLSSPHLQTTFLNFFGRPPNFSYRRHIFHASDGGTIALDWLMGCDVSEGALHQNNTTSKDDTTPIVIVVPGLTSDSASSYIKHLAFKVAKRGWNVVIGNHRGLGGVSVTSDCFYNAGWTEDIRMVIHYLHQEYPNAPLFAIGTSIGANVLVKYLGEEGEKSPVAGAVTLCSPWDLLIGDRFICRKLLQRSYDRALTIGLQGYAKLHEPRYARLANWEGIKKSRSIRDFDNHATCPVGKFETVDTYYRRCSSSPYVGNVSVPLLCISALDDPLCTREAIPWDECRANKNVVLATTRHGGHLAFFEGISAAGLWWVRAVDEYFSVLHSSPFMHVQKKVSGQQSPFESSVDQGPYINVAEDGLVTAVANEQTTENNVENESKSNNLPRDNPDQVVSNTQSNGHPMEAKSSALSDIDQFSEQPTKIENLDLVNLTAPFKRHLNQISRQSKRSLWLLVYIAVVTSWPLLGAALQIVFKRKLRNVLPAALLKR